jgi:hypothetical protein
MAIEGGVDRNEMHAYLRRDVLDDRVELLAGSSQYELLVRPEEERRCACLTVEEEWIAGSSDCSRRGFLPHLRVGRRKGFS